MDQKEIGNQNNEGVVQQEEESNSQQNQTQNEKKDDKNDFNDFELQDQLLNNIQKQIAENTSYISGLENLQNLEDEYQQNQIFLMKIKNLKERYPCLRKIRGDGSCFYRAYLFSIFEQIAVHNDKELYKKVLKLLEDSKQYLMNAGFEEIVIEDFQETLIEQFKILEKENVGIDEVLSIFLDKNIQEQLIMYARFLTSGYLKTNAILFENYIFDYNGIEDYCNKEVDPPDREADQVQMIALISYLQVPIKIIYLDQNVQYQEGQEMVLPEDANNVKATLLYRPGHYDLLYSKQTLQNNQHQGQISQQQQKEKQQQ